MDKAVYSPFRGTHLDDMLRDWGVDTLIVSGAETDVCVLAAVFDAMDHGYRVVVACDALCGSADETHDALMTVYRSRFTHQLTVMRADEIRERWRG